MADQSNGLLGTGSQNPIFVMPEFSRLPQFGYGNLTDQITDSMLAYQNGAGQFNNNAAQRYSFANQAPNVGGSNMGASTYAGGPNPFLNGFDPFAGRGNQPGGMQPGGQPNVPTPGGFPNPTPGNSPVPTQPLPTGNQPPPGAPVPNRTRGDGLLSNNTPTNTNAPANNGAPTTPVLTKGLPTGVQPYGGANPFASNTNLTEQQKQWALSGDPRAARMLSDSMGATGGQNAQGQMTPENLAFHQAINTYEQAGSAFNGPNALTPQDANAASMAFNLSQMGKTADGKPLGGWIGDKGPEALQYMVQTGQAIKGADGRYYAPPDPYYMPGGAGYGTAAAKALGY